MEIKVIFGNASDLETYLKRMKHHDQTTLKRYWSKILSTNKRSANQWFLVLNHRDKFASLVSMIPITILPLLPKMLAPHRWRVGTVFMPIPAAECYVFGEHVMKAGEVGQLHSGDMMYASTEGIADFQKPSEMGTCATEASLKETVSELPTPRKRGRPRKIHELTKSI